MAERILIVEDEPHMLKLLSMILRDKTPYEVIITNNPIEAVELLLQILKCPACMDFNYLKR